MEQLPSVNESRLEGDELDEGEDGEEVHDDLPEQPNQTSTSQRGLITKLYEWTGKNERWMFTQEQIERFRAQFYFFDKDKSGSVDVDELGLVFNQVEMDWTKEEIAEMVSSILFKVFLWFVIQVLEIDADQNGKIEFAEFLGLIARKLYLQQPRFQELREFFDYLDKDGNGIVSLDELQQVNWKETPGKFYSSKDLWDYFSFFFPLIRIWETHSSWVEWWRIPLSIQPILRLQ